MSIFGTIMEKLGFMKKKAADAVLGSEAQAAEAPAPADAPAAFRSGLFFSTPQGSCRRIELSERPNRRRLLSDEHLAP